MGKKGKAPEIPPPPGDAPPKVPNSVMGVGVSLARQRATRLNEKNKALLESSSRLKAEIDELSESQIEKCQEEIVRYQEHVQNLTDEINRVHGLREEAVATAVADKDSEIVALRKKIKSQAEELDRIADFRAHRESLLAELEDMKATNAQQSEDHKVALQDIERKNLAERQHIKNTMYNRMLATKEEIIREMVNGVDDTVRRTMAENEHMTTELAYQSRRAEDVMQKNANLTDDNKRLRSENSMLEQQVEELVKRSHLMHRVVHGLKEQKEDGQGKLKKLTEHLQSTLEPRELGKVARSTGAFDTSAELIDDEPAAEAPEAEHDSGKWFHTGMFGASRPATQSQESSKILSKPKKLVPAALHATNELLKKRLAETEAALTDSKSRLEQLKHEKHVQDSVADQTLQFLLQAAKETNSEMEQLHGVRLPELLTAAATNKKLQGAAVQALLNKLSVHMETIRLRESAASPSGAPAAGSSRRRGAAASGSTDSLPPLTKPFTRADLFSSLSSMSLPKSVLSGQGSD